MSEMTEHEIEQAAELIERIEPLVGLMAMQFSGEDLDLVERSLDGLEAEMRPRDVLAELFGRSAFNQTDQTSKATIPFIRAFITMCREVHRAPEASRLHVYGEELWG